MLPNEIVIEVTQEDINQAVPCMVEHCVVAIPAARALGKTVHATYVGLFVPSEDAKYLIPESVAKIMEAYDYGVKPEPFSFTATRLKNWKTYPVVNYVK